MRALVPRFLLALLVLVPAIAMAGALYTGEAPVNSQSDAERSEALKTALAAVVIQLTGDNGVLARGDVAKAVGDAEKYVLQYQYRRDAVADPAGGAPQTKLTLVATFDRSAVNRMLRDLGIGGAAGEDAAATLKPTEARIWVSGIRSAPDYARLMGYLGGLDLVRSAQPVEARGDGLLVRLVIGGDVARFLAAVGNGPQLRVISERPPIDGVDATLALSP